MSNSTNNEVVDLVEVKVTGSFFKTATVSTDDRKAADKAMKSKATKQVSVRRVSKEVGLIRGKVRNGLKRSIASFAEENGGTVIWSDAKQPSPLQIFVKPESFEAVEAMASAAEISARIEVRETIGDYGRFKAEVAKDRGNWSAAGLPEQLSELLDEVTLGVKALDADTDADSKVRKLEAELEALKAQMSEWKAKLIAKDSTIEKLTDENAELKEDVTRLGAAKKPAAGSTRKSVKRVSKPASKPVQKPATPKKLGKKVS